MQYIIMDSLRAIGGIGGVEALHQLPTATEFETFFKVLVQIIFLAYFFVDRQNKKKDNV